MGDGHFETRHRELRRESAGRLSGAAAMPLAKFNRATGTLVDDLVAAVRRWDDHLPGCRMWRHEVQHVGQLLICSGKDTLVVDEDCSCGYEEFVAKLAVLDEASRG